MHYASRLAFRALLIGRGAAAEESPSDAINPGNAQAVREAQIAAEAAGVQLQRYLDVRDAKDIEPAIWAAIKGHAEALLALTSAVLFSQRQRLAELAVKTRLPTVYGQPEYVDDGGLMSYGTNISDLYRRRG